MKDLSPVTRNPHTQYAEACLRCKQQKETPYTCLYTVNGADQRLSDGYNIDLCVPTSHRWCELVREGGCQHEVKRDDLAFSLPLGKPKQQTCEAAAAAAAAAVQQTEGS